MGIFLRCLAFLLAAAAPAAAQAQGGWPAKPVRIVVAYPPGGGIDVMARQIAEKLTAAWGQPVVVENRPGANTIVATDAVAKSGADGYTVLMTTDATFSINPHLYAKLPFDTQKDFIPVTMLVLLGADAAFDDGVDRFQMAGIRCQRQVDPVPFGGDAVA